MSKYIILSERAKKLEKLITNKEKYTVTDTLTDDLCDVIYVAKNATVTEADLDMVANMLDTRKIVIGTSQKKSGVKKFIYKFFGASHGENCCGVIGIPKEHLSSVQPIANMRAIRVIKNAEVAKLPIIELPLSKSEVRGKFSAFVGDIYSLFLVSQPLKYVFSSGVAFLIDFSVFVLLNKYLNIGFLKSEICIGVAWIISSLINFTINRSFVFKSSVHVGKALIEYYSLAGIVFLLKALLFELFMRVLHIPEIISKLIAEVIFFTSNYFIQKFFIFKKKKSTPEPKESSDDAKDQSDSSDKTE